jgi:hypothetical protein
LSEQSLEQNLEHMVLILWLSVSGWVGWVGCALSGGHCALRLFRSATDSSSSTLLWPALTRHLQAPVTRHLPGRFASFRLAQCAACSLRSSCTCHSHHCHHCHSGTFHVRCLPCAFHAPSLRSQETARNHGVLMPKSVEVFVVLSTC